jgi:hypothetical protein
LSKASCFTDLERPKANSDTISENEVAGATMLTRLRIPIALLIGSVILFQAASIQGASAATPTCTSQGFTFNYYAAGYQLNMTLEGVQAVISTSLPVVKDVNDNFTDEAVHIYNLTSGTEGLEIGWYVGWGTETQTYVTAPHAYATMNGPQAVDGPDVYGVGNTPTYYWYSTWNSGSTSHFRVDTSVNGSILWQTTIAGTDPGPGGGAAVGETENTSTPMGPSDFTQIQQFNSNGIWDNWTSMQLCTDPPYAISQNSGNSVQNSG